MSEPLMTFHKDTLYVGLACPSHLVDGEGNQVSCDQIVADRFYASGPEIGTHRGPHTTTLNGARVAWEGNAILSIQRVRNG